MISKAPGSRIEKLTPAIEAPDDKQYQLAVDGIKAIDLLGGKRTLRIKHQDAEYVLRITRNEKLILTK